ncbi:MFS transporter [Roseococcus pinisoli]|uniref:MFS transporter n=1 Tax=Roseococcus pinisoli TaxID=2835040 RepID=A0ABS5QBH6_9PROT|nr:MFS transporter [Roseococcus pinisoli]MBS7811047.1 MFS transporter [Roseococcus pinisoli]
MSGAEERRRSPFTQRDFRFQWPADFATSLAFEMETLILGWYVLVTTESVIWLTVFASLQFTGTLLAPLLGVAGDRIGHRNLLAAMRLFYLAIAGCVAGLAVLGALSPLAVLVAAGLIGLVKPSDIGVRNSLVAAILPPKMLGGAIGISRASMDAARVTGALAGAGIIAALGIGPAYGVVVGLYLIATLLTLAVREPTRDGPRAAPATLASTWRELAEGIALARTTPVLLAALWLAWLANFAAYPLSGGLLPHVAREVYGLDRTGLGFLVASFAAGALAGSMILSWRGVSERPAPLMLAAAGTWFALLMFFAQAGTPALGMAMLFLSGFMQSFCMIPMALLLLRSTEAAFRGRVMGLRMLAIYGMPLGLLIAGFAIERVGFAHTATAYALFGLAATALITWYWRAALFARLG